MRSNPVLSKAFLWLSVIFLTIFVLAVPRVVKGVDLTVDCNEGSEAPFHTIQSAVNALPEPPPGARNYIYIVSNCTGNVNISGQHRLWLGGNAAFGVARQ